MANYFIQKDTLTAMVDNFRLNKAAFDTDSDYGINLNYVESEEEQLLIPDAVYPVYVDYIDGYGDGDGQYVSDKDIFIAYGFGENSDGTRVPILYKTHRGAYEYGDEEYSPPDYEDPFYYVGTETIDDQLCDKWQKKEQSINGEIAVMYMYTHCIVVEQEQYFPTQIPDKLDELSFTPLDAYLERYMVAEELGGAISKNEFVELVPTANFSFSDALSSMYYSKLFALDPLHMVLVYRQTSTSFLYAMAIEIVQDHCQMSSIYQIDSSTSGGIEGVVLSSNQLFVVSGGVCRILTINNNNITIGSAFNIGRHVYSVDKLSDGRVVIAVENETYTALLLKVLNINNSTISDSGLSRAIGGIESSQSLVGVSISVFPNTNYVISIAGDEAKQCQYDLCEVYSNTIYNLNSAFYAPFSGSSPYEINAKVVATSKDKFIMMASGVSESGESENKVELGTIRNGVIEIVDWTDHYATTISHANLIRLQNNQCCYTYQDGDGEWTVGLVDTNTDKINISHGYYAWTRAIDMTVLTDTTICLLLAQNSSSSGVLTYTYCPLSDLSLNEDIGIVAIPASYNHQIHGIAKHYAESGYGIHVYTNAPPYI